jgi:hypothetical protein
MSTFSQGHAVLIGVGGDLPNTIEDARGLHELLIDPSRCAYPQKQVHLLSGEAADRASVLAALDSLAQQTSPESTAIIYFSGHGYRVNSAYGTTHYLLPYAYDMNRLPQTAVSGLELTQRLQAIPTQKLLLLLDCCHAGGLDDVKAPGVEFIKAPLPPEATALLAQGRGRVAIASSRANELSFAGTPYSAFTLALLEALCGAGASEQDGYVRVTDLALHAREQVPSRTRNRQHPILNFDQADNFVVAYYAAGDARTKGLPFPVEDIEIEPEPGALRATFTQQGQTVQGSQVNVGGDIHGPVGGGVAIRGKGHRIEGDVTGGNKTEITDSNLTIIGRDLFQGQIADRQDLIAELQKLREVLDQVVAQKALNEEEAILAGAQVDAAISHARKPKPDPDTITQRLNQAREIIQRATAGAGAAAGLVTAITKAMEMVRHLFS